MGQKPQLCWFPILGCVYRYERECKDQNGRFLASETAGYQGWEVLLGATEKYMTDLENYMVTPAKFPDNEKLEIAYQKGGAGGLSRGFLK
jgi:hypothetical protein